MLQDLVNVMNKAQYGSWRANGVAKSSLQVNLQFHSL